MISDENLVCKNTVEHYFMTDVNIFPDVHATPAMDHCSPAFDKAEESNFVEEKSPDKFKTIENFAGESLVTIKIQYVLCGHEFLYGIES
jgi:hypothetical protein